MLPDGSGAVKDVTDDAVSRIWSSYGLVPLARWRHCVSWSLGCLTSTWDIVHCPVSGSFRISGRKKNGDVALCPYFSFLELQKNGDAGLRPHFFAPFFLRPEIQTDPLPDVPCTISNALVQQPNH